MRRALSASLIGLLMTVLACTPAAPAGSPGGPIQGATAAPTQPLQSPAPRSTTAASQPITIPAPVRVRVPFEDPYDQAPDQVAVAGGAIWIERFSNGYELVRFDPDSEEITATVPLDYPVALMTDDRGAVWAFGPWGGAPSPPAYTVSRVNLTTGRIRAFVDVPVDAIAVGFGSIWLGAYEHLTRLDLGTGERVGRWEFPVDQVQVACDAVWTWRFDGGMKRLDPVTGETMSFEGEGPIYDSEGECWHRRGTEIERLWPAPLIVTDAPPEPAAWSLGSALWFEGSTFWHRPSGSMQRWDPVAGAGVGPTWTIDAQDRSSYWKIGDDGLVLSAGGSVWLVNGWEVVGFDIPAD